ncbi:MAG: tryptophan--tRNA ligase [Candidatus Pacebacteria bacterium]|nr:tryptophan--tRNA ligase [Candidatus Paceibacterota bacterium]
MKKRILTGDRPTGPLHLGHYVGSLENRVMLQDKYECFFVIADYQVLTDHLKETKRIGEFIKEIVLDYLAVGINPEKSTIFIQSKIPEIAELTTYFSMMISLARVQRNPTVKEEIKASEISEVSYGFVGYPISQAADILSVRAHLVPVGEDQVAHIEQTREIARTFNRLFASIFPVPEALVGRVARLPGLDSQKMSKSRGNAIFLSDSSESVRKKIMRAITDPARIHPTDKGHPDVCNIFRYYVAFGNPPECEEIETSCKSGKIGCVNCKKRMVEIINGFLKPIREKRNHYANQSGFIKDVLITGNRRAREEAKKTLELVREAMHFDYKDLLGKDN